MDSHSFQLLKPICRFFFSIPISLTFALIPLLVPLSPSLPLTFALILLLVPLSLSPSPSVCTFLLTLHMKSMFCVHYQFLPHTSCLCVWHCFGQAASPGSGSGQVNTLVGVQTNFQRCTTQASNTSNTTLPCGQCTRSNGFQWCNKEAILHRQHCSPRLGENCTENGWRCLHSL